MRITFVLPMHTTSPVGGFKIIYEYANRLSERGHQVTVIHRKTEPAMKGRRQRLREAILPWTKPQDKDQPIDLAPWFLIRPEVEMVVVPEVIEEVVPNADVLVATAWQTASWISSLEDVKGKKYYLIQHDETCMGAADEVNATWHLPMQKIVIARWLLQKAEEMGEAAVHMPNPMDFTHLGLDIPLTDRTPKVGMLYHTGFDWKGTADGIAAIAEAKAKSPNLEATLFGTSPRGRDIPHWMHYHQLPSVSSLRALYNCCSLFLQPSWIEGWGLTATEAMACGCALITTDNGGSRDYAEHEVTALVAPPREPSLLSQQIERLLQDDALRQQIAQAGFDHVQQYTWKRSVDLMERLTYQGTL